MINKNFLSLDEFDSHLDRYLKITHKKLNPQLFYDQFKMCFNSNSNFWGTYKYFKKNSRHNKQLTFI
jgi:hypothetical protein